MRLDKVKSIHQCFQVIYLTLYHSGCLGFKLEDGVRLYYTKWSCVYCYIVRFILLAGFVGGLVMKIIDEEAFNAMTGHLSPVVKFVLCLECSLCTITYVEAAFMMDVKRKKHLQYACRLQKIDEQLLKDFPSVNWNYGKTCRKYTYMIVAIYTYFTLISFGFVFNLAKCNCGWISSILVSASYACLAGSPGLAGFLFVAGMDVIRLRYRLLRKLFKVFFIAKSTCQRNETKDLRKLKLLEYYFKEYSSLIPAINEVFSSISGMGMFADFAILTNMGFLICSKALEAKTPWYEYLFILLFIAPRIYKVIITNIYGYLSDREFSNYISILFSYILTAVSDGYIWWPQENSTSIMRIDEGKSVHQCFQLIYLTLYHSGCLGFKLENGVRLYYTKWSCVYGYIVRFILLASFMGGIVVKIIDEEAYNTLTGHMSPVVKFVLFLECTLCILTYIEASFMMDVKRKKHLQYAHRLQKIDEQLLKDFPLVNWNYEKSSRKYNRMTVGVYTYFNIIAFGFVFKVSNCGCGWISSIVISASYSCLTCSPGVACFLFVAGMDMVRLRYRLLRKLFKTYFITKSDNQRNDTKDLRKLKLLEYYFKEYSSLIPVINEVFGSISGGSMFYDFAILTNMGFLICSKALEEKSPWHEYLFIVLFIAPRIYKVIVTNIYGYLSDREKRNCGQEFLRMEEYFSKPFIVRDILQSFLHWRMHNNYYFTVGKALRCNLTLLFMLLNSIANYIIILIQLQFQQNIITRSLQHDLSEDVELIAT